MSILAITGAGGTIGRQLLTYLDKALQCERKAVLCTPNTFRLWEQHLGRDEIFPQVFL